MKLLIDFGNTRYKWALLDGDVMGDMNMAAYEKSAPVAALDDLLQALPLNAVDGIHVVSVLNETFNAAFEHKAKQHSIDSVQYYFPHKERYGVVLSYESPMDCGADRYAGMVAAHHMHTGDKIIIDCGTAVTIDAIDQYGKHLGGIILPGEEILRSSLVDNTDRVFFDQAVTEPDYLNASTSDAVIAGAALGLKHSVWGIVSEIRQTLDEHTVILTGGNVARLDNASAEPYQINPMIILEGLQIMVNFEHNIS